MGVPETNLLLFSYFPSPFLLHLHSMDINTGHRPRDLVPQLDTPETPESGSHFRFQAVLASVPEGTAN